MIAGKILAAAGTVAGLSLGAAGSLPQAGAAELIVLTNQGATPGVRELATAFERASGHKVTVIQEDAAALERRLNSNGPADLITSNPAPIEELIRTGKVVAGTATPFVLAGLGLSVRAGAPKPDISTVAAYKARIAGREVGRLFARLQRHARGGRDRAARPYRSVEAQDGAHRRRAGRRLSGERRLRNRHSADQHHGGSAGNGVCRCAARIPEQALPVERCIDGGREAAASRARDGQIHGIA